MADPKSETLNAGTITESLGMVGTALSNESADKSNGNNENLELQEFLKQLVSSTTELASQFEELNILQKDALLTEQRKTAEELSELKAGKQKQETSLIEPLNGLTEAIDRLTKLIEETDFGGSSILDLIPGAAAGAALTEAAVAATAVAGSVVAGVVAAPAIVGSALIATDQGMRAVYNEADEKSKALEEYGMKAVKNSSGFTEAYEINGIKYPANKLPKDYQTILDAYGPTADPRNGTTKRAIEEINQDPERFNQIKQTAKAAAPTPMPAAPAAPASVSAPMPITNTPQSTQTPRPIDSASSNLNQGVLAKTEELEKAESTVEVASPIMAGQSSNQPQQPLKATITNFGMSGVDEVPNPNYSGGILESELYP